MQEIYLGQIRGSIDDFWKLQPYELVNAIRGYNQEKTEEIKRSWEQARIIGFSAMKPHIAKELSIEKYLPLPWSDSGDQGSVSTEAMEKLRQKIKDRGWEKLENGPG